MEVRQCDPQIMIRSNLQNANKQTNFRVIKKKKHMIKFTTGGPLSVSTSISAKMLRRQHDQSIICHHHRLRVPTAAARPLRFSRFAAVAAASAPAAGVQRSQSRPKSLALSSVTRPAPWRKILNLNPYQNWHAGPPHREPEKPLRPPSDDAMAEYTCGSRARKSSSVTPSELRSSSSSVRLRAPLLDDDATTTLRSRYAPPSACWPVRFSRRRRRHRSSASSSLLS